MTMIVYPIPWFGSLAGGPNTRQLKIGAVSTVGISASPFTGQTQVQEWPGELWTLDASFPPIQDRDLAEPILAALCSLRGRSGTFMCGDQGGRTPRGVATGSPRTVATNAAGSKRLVCSGWTPSITGILKRGDYIQIRRNKLTAPGDDFTNAAWIKTQATVGSANAIVDPIGDATAERVTPTGGATNTSVINGLTFDCAGKTFTFRVWLKAASGTPSISIHILNQASTIIAATVCALTTAWQEFTVTGTMGDADTGLQAAIGGNGTWVVAEGAVDMWGASLGGDSDCELKKILSDANSDGTGGINALDIFPRLHADVPTYSRIITANAQGAFRLIENKFDWDFDHMKMYGITFTAAEAL